MSINQPRMLASSVGILVACLALLSGCNKFAKKQGPPPPSTPEVAVVVVQPEQVTISTELPGRTSAYLVAEVRPQVNGIIQKRLFQEGSDVKAGDVLYQIDPTPYQAAYDTAIASLAKAEAQRILVELRYKRGSSLVASGSISQEEYDNASAALRQAKADIDASTATIASARVNLEYTRITAPISGRIGKSNVTVGSLATSHQGVALATIQQTDPIYVDATQSSARLIELRRKLVEGKMKLGQGADARVKLHLEDGTAYPQEGSLKFSDVTVDPSTGSFTLRMVFPNPDQVLLPGMYVRTTIEQGTNDNAILVPQRGVARDTKGNPIALVVDGSDKVEQRTLKIERAVGDKWLVGEGLKPGDRVIVEGVQMAKPGSAVKVVPFKAETETSSSADAKRPAAAAK